MEHGNSFEIIRNDEPALTPEVIERNETIAQFLVNAMHFRSTDASLGYILDVTSDNDIVDYDKKRMHERVQNVLRDGDEVNRDEDEVVSKLVEFLVRTTENARDIPDLRRAARKLLGLRIVEQSYDDSTYARWDVAFQKLGIEDILEQLRA